MNRSPESDAIESAADELALLQAQIREARAELASLRQVRAGIADDPSTRRTAQLLEANEQLVLAALQMQIQAETAMQQADACQISGELRHQTERLESENRLLVEARRVKSEFVANMSHELRTPLNAVIGFAELLHADLVPPRSVQFEDFTAHIVSSGRHLLQLINDVLDLSKVQAGKLAFHPAPLDLTLVVKEVTELLAPLALRDGVACSIDVEPGLEHLVLDPLRLKQALYNYLSNAIKFSAEGGRVTVRARLDGDACFRLEVQDTGIGIALDDQARLFENFAQLDSGSNKGYQGAGLGLALTRLLVEAQGGSVGVQSTPGVGSVFHLVLPRIAVDCV